MKIAYLAILAISGALASSAAHAEDAALAAIAGAHNEEFRSIIGMAAQPEDHTAAYRGSTGAYVCANTTSGGGRVIRYPMTVPDARTFEFVRIWGFKTTGTADTTARLRRSCMSQSQVDPTTVVLDTVNITSTTGQFTALLFGDPTTPFNLDCRYWVEFEFGPSTQACAAGIQDLRIERLRVQSRMGDRIFRGSFRAYTP
jgi:hypothetical protein